MQRQYHQGHQIYQQIPAMAPSSTAASALSSSASHAIYQPAPSTGVAGHGGTTATATMRRQQSLNTATPKQHDTVEAIPSSNSIDSAMYERDKQIYRCSTMRQGGKWDPKYKPSILNCPLPEIPKDAESPKKEVLNKDQHSSYSKTLQRPPMKLPPTGKAIPPPKIETQTSVSSPPPVPSSTSTVNPNIKHTNMLSKCVSLPEKSSPPTIKEAPTTTTNSTVPSIANESVPSPNATSTAAPTSPNAAQEESTINPNDESNYAVTEL